MILLLLLVVLPAGAQSGPAMTRAVSFPLRVQATPAIPSWRRRPLAAASVAHSPAQRTENVGRAQTSKGYAIRGSVSFAPQLQPWTSPQNAQQDIFEPRRRLLATTLSLGLAAAVFPSAVSAGSFEEYMEKQRLLKEKAAKEGCYVVVEGQAYDVGGFMGMHRGGSEVLASACCSDVTGKFKGIHQFQAAATARETLKSLPTVSPEVFDQKCGGGGR